MLLGRLLSNIQMTSRLCTLQSLHQELHLLQFLQLAQSSWLQLPPSLQLLRMYGFHDPRNSLGIWCLLCHSLLHCCSNGLQWFCCDFKISVSSYLRWMPKRWMLIYYVFSLCLKLCNSYMCPLSKKFLRQSLRILCP